MHKKNADNQCSAVDIRFDMFVDLLPEITGQEGQRPIWPQRKAHSRGPNCIRCLDELESVDVIGIISLKLLVSVKDNKNRTICVLIPITSVSKASLVKQINLNCLHQ